MKKCLAVIISLVMVLSMSNISAIAETSNQNTSFTVGTVYAEAGETVDVDIDVTNNPGIIGAIIRLTFDTNLTLKNATKGTAFSTLEMTKPGKFQSPCQFTWDSVEIAPEDIKDGTILTLTFEIPNNAEKGTNYNINISAEDGDVINNELKPVKSLFQSGKIVIDDEKPETPETPDTPIETDRLTFYVNSVNTKLGNQVDVQISIKNNPGIIGAILRVDYESLILKNAICGEAFSMLEMTKPGKYQSPCQFTWDSVDINESEIKDGVILTLSFDLPENAKDGDIYVINISGEDGDFVDKNLHAVSSDFNSGYVKVTTECNHNYVVIDSKESDCENAGYITYKCQYCNDTYTESLEALGHSYSTTDSVKAPTVSSEGILRHYCSRCDSYYDEPIPKSIPEGSTVSTSSTVAIITTDSGTTISVPKDSKSVKENVDGTYKVEINENTSITVNSNTTISTNESGQIVLTATDGNSTTTITVPSGSTVVKKGDSYEVTFTKDNKTVTQDVPFGESITINENGKASCNGEHKWDKGKVTLKPTCTSKGKRVYTCTVCNTTKTVNLEIIDHTIVVDKAVAPTFKKAGRTEGTHCSACGTVLTAQKTVKKLASPKLSKVKKGRKQFKATWKSIKGVDGYQIQYSLKKNMKSSKKKTVKGATKKSLTVKKLKGGKKYYVRIRAYKIINGKKVYSSWSAKKTVTTKK